MESFRVRLLKEKADGTLILFENSTIEIFRVDFPPKEPDVLPLEKIIKLPPPEKVNTKVKVIGLKPEKLTCTGKPIREIAVAFGDTSILLEAWKELQTFREGTSYLIRSVMLKSENGVTFLQTTRSTEVKLCEEIQTNIRESDVARLYDRQVFQVLDACKITSVGDPRRSKPCVDPQCTGFLKKTEKSSLYFCIACKMSTDSAKEELNIDLAIVCETHTLKLKVYSRVIDKLLEEVGNDPRSCVEMRDEALKKILLGGTFCIEYNPKKHTVASIKHATGTK